jgi:hypothetical protein
MKKQQIRAGTIEWKLNDDFISTPCLESMIIRFVASYFHFGGYGGDVHQIPGI